MWLNPKFPADLAIFTEEILNGKLHFLCSVNLLKYIMFELKKYRRVIFDGTEYWCKIWEKTELCFPKRYGEFGKFAQAE